MTVFQNRRWDGDFLTVRRLVDDGALGDVARFESRFERFRPEVKPDAWRELPDAAEGGGLLLDLGAHLVDQARVLFGDPVGVYAEIDVRRPGAEVDDDVFLALEHPHGVRSHLWMSATAPLYGPRFRVSGLKAGFGVDGLDPQEPQLAEGKRPGEAGFGEAPPGVLVDAGGSRPVELERGRYEASTRACATGCAARARHPSTRPTRSPACASSRRRAAAPPRDRSSNRRECHEDEPGDLGARSDGHALRSRGLPARARARVDARQGQAGGRGPRRPHGRLRVPLPGELNEENLEEVRGALAGHDIYCIATGLHVDPRFGRGALSSPDPGLRREAVDITLRAADFAASVGAQLIIWPGIEGYNYPFQTRYAESWGWFIDGVRQAAERCREHGIKLFLEHKNSEPAMKIFMRNIGMTLHVIHTLRRDGLDNVQVNMDWQHLLMNDENLGEYAALLDSEGLLGHQHANSGWGTFDDDNMVGATAFMETLELALELRRAGYGRDGDPRRLGFDLYPYTEDQVAAGAALRAPVALHRRGRGPDRRGGAARGPAAQGRRARVRARLRRAGRALT